MGRSSLVNRHRRPIPGDTVPSLFVDLENEEAFAPKQNILKEKQKNKGDIVRVSLFPILIASSRGT